MLKYIHTDIVFLSGHVTSNPDEWGYVNKGRDSSLKTFNNDT